jgi:hypothetical protein
VEAGEVLIVELVKVQEDQAAEAQEDIENLLVLLLVAIQDLL